jgi:hypothetical protein
MVDGASVPSALYTQRKFMKDTIKSMIQNIIAGQEDQAEDILKTVLHAKVKEQMFGEAKQEDQIDEAAKIGWYVTDANDKTVAGPFEKESDCDKEVEKRGGDEKGFTKSYISDYDARRMNESSEYTLDQITKMVKPVFKKVSGVSTDEEYEALLDKYGDHADVIDQYFSGPSLGSVADKIHYQQNLDKDLASFLETLNIKEANEEKQRTGWFVLVDNKPVEGPVQDKKLVAQAQREHQGGVLAFGYVDDNGKFVRQSPTAVKPVGEGVETSMLLDLLEYGQGWMRNGDSWALLPATQSLWEKAKVKLSDCGTIWDKNTVYICMRNSDAKKIVFLSSSGTLRGVSVGDTHSGHHDQRMSNLGRFEVLNIVDLKNGEVVKKANDEYLDVKAPLYVFK